MDKPLKLGHHLEICFSVENMEKTIEFYKKLGMKIYSGGPDKGWCTMTDGTAYFALFPQGFIEKEFGVKILFNFRGGNITKLIAYLKNRGIKFQKENPREDGTGDAIFTDPEGNKFYLDTVDFEERIDLDE
ncbi:MAG: hypothetical protein D6732_18365 [Methanobacteriota archaeon]|nr:MAG: hypothetical protein D6732_18365 [Euryarchaeota archaeon]